VALLTACFIVVGAVLVATDYTINDEGMLTHYWASWLRRDFVPMFFFQKTHPVLCALYAPVSAWGPRVTLTAHVIVAATAIPMLAAIARALEFRLPNLPSLIVALSPLFFLGAAAGLSNVDGVVGVVLTLYLLCARRQPLAAGLVLGMLPWVRFELTVFCGVMAVYALATREARSMLVTMVLFPLVYVATGAVYHEDLLWVLHFPPAAPFDPENPLYVTPTQLLGFRYLLEPAAALTPVAGLAAMLSLGRLRRVEYAVLVYAVLVVLAMNILPVLHLGNFGTSPRYMLHLLPALALLLGRVLEPLWEQKQPRLALLVVGALGALWVATRQQNAAAANILIAGYATVLGAWWLRASTFAVAVVVALIAAAPLMPLRTDVGRPSYLGPMLAWLQAHPEHRGDRIYTNAQLLAPYLESRVPGIDVHYMLGNEMTYETKFLINVENGQLDRIGKLSATEFYGKHVLPPFAPENFPDNALLVLRVDNHRLGQLLPDATWAARLEVIEDTPHYRMARIRPARTSPPAG
jgi:hypothetical protein